MNKNIKLKNISHTNHFAALKIQASPHPSIGDVPPGLEGAAMLLSTVRDPQKAADYFRLLSDILRDAHVAYRFSYYDICDHQLAFLVISKLSCLALRKGSR